MRSLSHPEIAAKALTYYRRVAEYNSDEPAGITISSISDNLSSAWYKSSRGLAGLDTTGAALS